MVAGRMLYLGGARSPKPSIETMSSSHIAGRWSKKITLKSVLLFLLIWATLIPLPLIRFGNSLSSAICFYHVALAALFVLSFRPTKKGMLLFCILGGLLLVQLAVGSTLAGGAFLKFQLYGAMNGLMALAFLMLTAKTNLATISRPLQITALCVVPLHAMNYFGIVNFSFIQVVINPKWAHVAYHLSETRDLYFLAGSKYVWALFYLICGILAAKRPTRMSPFVIAAALAGIYFSMSKTDLIACAVSAPILLTTAKVRISVRWVAVSVAVLAMLFSSLFLAWLPQIQTLLSPNALGTYAYRLSAWGQIWTYLGEHPHYLISGNGLNGFRMLYAEQVTTIGFGHNVGLNLIVELGLLGAFLFCLLLASQLAYPCRWMWFFVIQRLISAWTADTWFGTDTIFNVTVLTILCLHTLQHRQISQRARHRG